MKLTATVRDAGHMRRRVNDVLERQKRQRQRERRARARLVLALTEPNPGDDMTLDAWALNRARRGARTEKWQALDATLMQSKWGPDG